MNKELCIRQIALALEGVVETPLLDARFFVENFQDRIPTEAEIHDFLYRRKQGEPVSKIIAKRGFWALDFYVTKDVLDPRADTETLIEAVLKHFPDKTQSYKILDVGTGSGCIIASLLYEYKKAKGVAVDISEKALEVAKKNLQGFDVEFFKRDLFETSFLNDIGVVDIIVSNPPYIKTKDIDALENNVRLYDPILALDGGEDGLNAYRALAQNLKSSLKKGTVIFFEIGQNQDEDVKKIMQTAGYSFLNQYKDLAGIVRVLVFLAPKE